jgi:hypothetical protein
MPLYPPNYPFSCTTYNISILLLPPATARSASRLGLTGVATDEWERCLCAAHENIIQLNWPSICNPGMLFSVLCSRTHRWPVWFRFVWTWQFYVPLYSFLSEAFCLKVKRRTEIWRVWKTFLVKESHQNSLVRDGCRGCSRNLVWLGSDNLSL